MYDVRPVNEFRNNCHVTTKLIHWNETNEKKMS